MATVQITHQWTDGSVTTLRVDSDLDTAADLLPPLLALYAETCQGDES